MNNWFIKFFMFAFLALAIGMAGAWITSFFTWNPRVQKGVGFLLAGLSVVSADLGIRSQLDRDGVYQEVYLLPLLPIRIPAWIFGVVVAIGGVVILASEDD